MSLPLLYLSLARQDIDEAYVHYEGRQTGLGEQFLSRLHDQVERIRENPQLYGVLDRDVRAAPMRRFPYVVYYRAESTRTVVIAVLHGRRNPRIWQSRA